MKVYRSPLFLYRIVEITNPIDYPIYQVEFKRRSWIPFPWLAVSSFCENIDEALVDIDACIKHDIRNTSKRRAL